MRILSNLSVSGLLGLNSVADANTDTDKFLVLDSSGIVRYRTGAEVFSDIGAGGAAAYTSVLQHTVKAGETLTKGQAVYVTSADGTNMIVGKASNDTEATSSKTLGLIAQNLATNDQGFVITEGLLAGLDTSTASAGDPVWLGTGGNLLFGLANKPYAPTHMVFIGIVTRAQQNNGEIFVKVQNGFELQELHNVQVTSTPSDNTVLSYETSTSLYKMKSIPTLLGYTPVTNARNITINGTTYDLSADRTWSVGTHTGSLTTGYIPKATGTTTLTDGLMYDTGSAILIGTQTAGSGKFMVYSTSPDNHYQAVGSAPSFRFADTITSPNYTGIFGLATASNHFIIGAAAGDMVLSNNTTSAIGNFLFGTGATERMRISPAGNVSINNTNNTYRFDVTGTVRFTGQLRLESTITNGTHTYTLPSATGTLALTSDIPSLSGYVPTSRTITINGVTYDLSADRSWTVSGGVSGSGTTNYLPKFTGTSSIGNSIVQDDGSTLTIGGALSGRNATFTSSTANIGIIGTGTFSYLQLGHNGGATKYSYLVATNDGMLDIESNIVKFTDYSGASERMRINASGNVSIGNTNDTYKLDVSGASRILASTYTAGAILYLRDAAATGSNTTFGGLFLGSSPGTDFVLGKQSTNAVGSFAIKTGGGTTLFTLADTGAATFSSSVTTGGNILVPAGSGLAWSGDASRIMTPEDNVSGALIQTPGIIRFNAGGSERARITSGGNVGIGTTNPSYPLQVRRAGGGGSLGISIDGVGSTDRTVQYFAIQDSASGAGAGHAFYYRPASSTTDTLGLLLNEDGNVGIGTTSPNVTGFGGATALTIQASIQPVLELIGSTYNASGVFGGGVVQFRNSSTAVATLGVENLTGNQGNMVFYTNNGSTNTERMRITSGGNVVIGGTNAASRFNVRGSNSNSQIEFDNFGSGVNFILSYDRVAAAYKDIVLITNASNNTIYAATSGNVGIGTTSPQTELHVKASSGWAEIRIDGASGSAASLEYYSNGMKLGDLYCDTSANMIFRNNVSNERMRITNVGDVLINATMTTQMAKFYVNGKGAFGSLYIANLSTGTVYSNMGNLTNTNPSDIRLKNTIKPLTYGLNEVLQLNPKTFYYNDDATRARLKYGFIAQEVKEVMPDLVRRLGSDNDYLGLETEGIYVALVNAIKESHGIINKLKERIEALESK